MTILNNKTLLAIPTYNERDNVDLLYVKVRSLYPALDILFVDDNSPDGTAEIVKGIQKKDEKLFLIERSGRLGVGSAHKVAINFAYENHYETLVTMDADLTHSPNEISRFIELSKNYCVVVGSRYLKDDSLVGWNLVRKFLTNTAHVLTTILLDLPYDSTGAFRCYRLDKIGKSVFSKIESNSYSFFFEGLYVLKFNGYSITEFAISLPPRTYGSSKMRFRDIFKSLWLLMVTFFRRCFRQRSLQEDLPRLVVSEGKNEH